MTIQRNPELVVPTLLKRLAVAKLDAAVGGGKNLSKLAPWFDRVEKEIQEVKDVCPQVKNMEEFVMAKFRDLEQEIDGEIFENPSEVEKIKEKLTSISKKLQTIKEVTSNIENPPIHSTTSSENSKPQHLISQYQKPSEKWQQLGVEEKIMEDEAMTTNLKVSFDILKPQLKICLLCFSIFPENSIIKKRPMIYWWIGEGLVTHTKEKTAEVVGDDIFDELKKMGMIKPVYKNRCPIVNRYTIHPWIRRMLISVAKKAEFFDFDSTGIPTKNFFTSHRACLVSSNGKGTDKGIRHAVSVGTTYLAVGPIVPAGAAPNVHRPERVAASNPQPMELRTLFNGDEQILDFKADGFLKMKKLVVLQLGRWQSMPTHHIELKNTDCLKGLGALKHLKYLSLQGISRITELPASIGKLNFLKILDLKACHNLENLPTEIKLLRNLTHLDVSECYLLDHIPKELKDLSALEVLKGFMIGNSSKDRCNLGDLAASKKLRKLSINIGSNADIKKEEPNNVDARKKDELAWLEDFEKLKVLTITWGGVSLPSSSSTSLRTPQLDRTPTMILKSILLPLNLEKLDLRCFPRAMTPDWLMPSVLKKLKRLYIRGGELGGLVHKKNQQWKVEVLRLKFLKNFRIKWSDLQADFPELVYLEKIKCAKLNSFPCDEEGVWER